jgi:hypothetical protein
MEAAHKTTQFDALDRRGLAWGFNFALAGLPTGMIDLYLGA